MRAKSSRRVWRRARRRNIVGLPDSFADSSQLILRSAQSDFMASVLLSSYVFESPARPRACRAMSMPRYISCWPSKSISEAPRESRGNKVAIPKRAPEGEHPRATNDTPNPEKSSPREKRGICSDARSRTDHRRRRRRSLGHRNVRQRGRRNRPCVSLDCTRHVSDDVRGRLPLGEAGTGFRQGTLPHHKKSLFALDPVGQLL